MITHDEQRRIWDEEHRKPNVLPHMDSHAASSGVTSFFEYLVAEHVPRESGIEMGCGKGRNSIWLAEQGVRMSAFDFSASAINEAVLRARAAGAWVDFSVGDATAPWPYESHCFDIGVDCFASTDIESAEGRAFALSEMRRVLKPGGHLLAYLLSTEDGFHAQMLRTAPAGEKNAFVHPTGKFEKVYGEEEIRAYCEHFTLVKHERIRKQAVFAGKTYDCLHHWLILRA